MTSKKTITIKKKTIPIISTITETIITNKEKGDLYEKYIYYHLQNLCTYKNVWLWKNIPEYELLKSQIMDDWNTARLTRKREHIENRLPDFGTDLLALETDADGTDKYSIIQCKNYNDSRTLRAEDLGTFYFMMYRYSKFVNGLVFHTNDLSTNLINHNLTNDNVKYLKVKVEEGKYDLGNLDDNIDDEENSTVILKPHQYQIDAYNALKGKTRGILQMACGTGKTLVSIMLAKDYNQNIIIAPLKAYCEQNMVRFASQISSDYKMLIIDSDNDGRNIENIKKFIKTNAKFCLFCTYKSIDIINEIKELKLIDDCYFIIDEFHNISKQDLENPVRKYEENDDSNDETFEDDEDFDEDEETVEDNEEIDEEDDETIEDDKGATEMYKLLHSDARIMFMSATPRLFENDEDTEIDTDIFGEIDYTYSMSDAIEQKIICDYRIIVPTLSISKYEGIEKIYKECNLKDYDKELVVKSRYIINGSMHLGNRKCIIYLQSQAECKEMTEIINEQCKNYFAIKNYCTYIISSDLKAERAFKLKKFANFEDYSFICSVDILNECIDIPKCDSIFIAYPSKSKIRNIQRLCRANRKDISKINKISNIFLWADEYKTDLVDFITHIKEFDPKFTFNKINRINVSNENKCLMVSDVESKENKDLENIVIGFKVAGNWMEKLEMVKKYIDENGKRPTHHSKDKNFDIKRLGKWLSCQITNYNQKKYSIKNINIYNKFEEFINNEKYKKYFIILSVEENFNINLNKIKTYIDENKKRPSNRDVNKDIKYIGSWLSTQNTNYKKKELIMKYEYIYNKWSEFINDKKYKQYFILPTMEENFNINLEKVKKYIDYNKKKPSSYSKDKNINFLGEWISSQKTSYNNKEFNMKDENIYNKWTEFINDDKYKEYFQSQYEDFIINLNEVKKYIDKNNKIPNSTNFNKDIKYLGRWISKQKSKYNSKIFNMKNENIYNKWTEFINDEKYKTYFNK